MSLVSFVVPLLPRARSTDFARDLGHLRATLRSLANQSHGDFDVTVVAHAGADGPRDGAELGEPAAILRRAGRFALLRTAEPVPPDTPGQRMLDKLRKTHRGLLAAAGRGSRYVMPVDADDLVHRDLVRTVARDRPRHGFKLTRGYGLLRGDGRRGRLFAVPELHRVCGTSLVVDFETAGVPASFSRAEEDRCVLLGFAHGAVADELARRGTPLAEYPRRGAVYVVGHGGNESAKKAGYCARRGRLLAKSVLRGRPLTGSVRRAFALDPHADGAADPAAGPGCTPAPLGDYHLRAAA